MLHCGQGPAWRSRYEEGEGDEASWSPGVRAGLERVRSGPVSRSIRLLGSSRVATALIAIIVLYSAIATFVPQGSPEDPAVTSWAADWRLFEVPVRLLGLHHAFTSSVFLACAALLVISAVLCSWQRTKIAAHRAHMLRNAKKLDAESLGYSHDLLIPYDSRLTPEEALSLAADELEQLGIATERCGGVLVSASPPWTAWGSPVFHWALMALVIVIVMSGLQRSRGLVGLAVGETKPNTAASYGFLNAGPLHSWSANPSQLRLDRFEPEYTVGGVDRGPTPTVSLLDSGGAVIKTQRVYSNNPLKSGSLTIHSDDYGLAARIEVSDADGERQEKGIQYVDFDPDDPQGTRSTGGIVLRGREGTVLARARVTVPLELDEGELQFWMPATPTARLVAALPDGRVMEDRVMSPGQRVVLATGHTIRLDSIDWYYRLAVVDDWTIPIIYGLLVVAFLALAASLVLRQQMVVAAGLDGPDGPVLGIRVRLWRNAACEREAIAERLTLRLAPVEKAGTHDT